MEDNKLIYPVGFKLDEKSEKEVKKNFGQMQEEMRKMLDTIAKASSKSINSKELSKELTKIKAGMTAVTHAVKKYSEIQERGAKTSAKIAIEHNKVAASMQKAGAEAAIMNNKIAESEQKLGATSAVSNNKAAISLQKLEAQTARTEMAKLRLANAQNKINTGFKTQSRLLSQVTMQIGAYTSIYALLRFATAVRDITAQFELQRVALTAILQDKAAADKIFGQVLVQALESPFRIKDIISYTKQLAAYRVETENLFETTKRLADISAGLGVDMSRLVLAYGQVRAASVLRGQELRQFTEAGIPLVKLLADKFTELRGVMVSTGEVFELISRRAVPFRMIEEIFNDMTNAGGMFYNMQKIQAETLHGVWMNLKDAYDKMYYEIGQKNMGVLKGLGMFLRNMADNWELVSAALQSVVFGYLSYITVTKILTVSTKVLTAAQIEAIATERALLYVRLRGTMSVKLATAATKLYTIAQNKLAVANNFLTRAFWKLTAAMAANPIAAVVAGVVALTVGLGLLIVRANDLGRSIKNLNESLGEFESHKQDVGALVEEFNKLNIVGPQLSKNAERLSEVTDELAKRFPLAVTEFDNFGNAVSISAERVNELYDAEVKLITLDIEKEIRKQERLLSRYEKQAASALRSADFYKRGLDEGNLPKVSQTQYEQGHLKWMKEVRDYSAKATEARESLKKAQAQLAGLTSDAGGVVDDALFGVHEYVFSLEELRKDVGAAPIKLFESLEDIQKLSIPDLFKKIAEKYKEATSEAESYNQVLGSQEYLMENIIASGTQGFFDKVRDKENYVERRDEAQALADMAELVLEKYGMLGLVRDENKKKDETAQELKKKEIQLTKDAVSAYEKYLTVMTRTDALKEMQNQVQFAGVTIDVSSENAYEGYLRGVLSKIKGRTGFEDIARQIEKELTDIDWDRISNEFSKKIEQLSRDISRQQDANEFFEKILGITGDIELSTNLTLKYTGMKAQEVSTQLREDLQVLLRESLGNMELDLSEMELPEISNLISEIPEEMTAAKKAAEDFFKSLDKEVKESEFSLRELDVRLRELEMEDATLFGTGVTLDVQKVVRDLSKANRELAKEKVGLENDIRKDARAKDKKWLNEQLVNLDKIFRIRQENEKTLSQDKLNDLAKGMFEEQKRMLGIDALLNDISDKSIGQINKAIERINEMAEIKVLEIPESAINALALYGYEIDNIAESDLDGIFEKTGELIGEDEQKVIRLVVAMKELGISTKELNSAYAKLVGQQKKDTTDEKQKKQRDMLISSAKEVVKLTNSITEMAEAMDDDRIAGLTSTLGSLADVIESIAAGAKTGGWVGAIVSAVATIADMLVGDFKKIGELKDAVADSKLEAWVKSVDELSKSDGIFGETFFMGARDNIDAASESMKKYNKVLGEATKLYADIDPETQWKHNYGNPLGFISNWLSNVTVKIFGTQTDLFAQKDAYIEAFKKAYESGYNEVEAFVLRINNRGGFFNFFGWQDKFAVLKDVVEELGYELYGKGGILNTEALQAALTTYGDEMTEEQKRWVEEAIAATEKYAEAMDALDDYVSKLFGNLASDIASSMIDSFKDIGVAAYGLEGVFSDISESIINNLLQTMLIEEVLNKYSESLKAIMKDTSLSDEERANALLGIMADMKIDILAFAKGKNAFLEAAKEAGLLDVSTTSGGDFGVEDWAKAIAEIDALIASLTDNAGRYNEELLNGLRKDLDDLVKSIGTMEQILGEEMTALLAEEPEKGGKAYEEWAQRVAELEDKFASLGISYEEYLAKQERYKELLRQIAVMEDRYADSEAIKLLLKQKKELLDKIYEAGYGKYATDEMKQDETLKEYLADIEFYNQLAAEATDPEQQEKWKELARLAKLAFDNEVIDGFNTKLEESLSKFDDNIDKMAFLKNMLSTLSDPTKIAEVKRQLEELGGIVYEDLYSAYADDATKFNDELKDMQKQIQWAIENGYPELAEWIQKAYDTKVLDEWKAGIDEVMDGMEDDFERFDYIQGKIRQTKIFLAAAILTGNQKWQEDLKVDLQWLNDILAELSGSMEENMWDKYATDAQKYEQELSDINKDLQWALDNYPELADEIADAFNTRVLEEWQDKWDETFGDIDLNLERLNAIEAELAAIGVPEISEEEARAGRDAALLSGDTDAYNYYQEQLLMHQKINILLKERAEIIDELGNKYKTDEETYQDEIAQYESDIAAMRALLKEAREDGDAESVSHWEKEIADAGAAMEEFINNADFDALQEEFERQFGDISDIGTAEVKKMLDAFRQQVEDSELPPEMKEKILDDIDDIYDDLDKRTQESFNKIGTAIKDIGSLLENFGAEQGLVDSISAIGDAVSVLGDITYAIAKNDWWSVFSLAVKFVNSLVKATQNLVQLVDVDSISGLAEAYDKLTYAISRSVGMDRKRNQDAARQNLVDQRNEIARELQKEKSKWGFSFDWFGKKVQILGPDQGVVNALTQQLNQIDGALTDLGDTMKEEFLQTDYTSFSESLAEILIAPWDSYMEMMDAVNELTDQTINNIVKHALSLHLQAQVKQALDALYERGISEDSFDIFRGDLAKIVQDGQLVAKYYGQFYDDMASSSEAYNTISRITESQANSFLGYYQNYLIIMTDMHNIMKRIWDNMNHGTININLDAHLSALQTIVANTGAIANNTSRIGQLADDMRSVKNSLAKSGAY